jgi:uncharacterized protein (TIGR02300 family)
MEETGVTKPTLGIKRTCLSCETRFFDLNKNPAICPKCGEKYKIPTTKPKRASTPEPNPSDKNIIDADGSAEDPKAKEIAPEINDGDNNVDNENDELDDELNDDLDENLMENTSELDEDSDELSEVFEHVNVNDTDKQ